MPTINTPSATIPKNLSIIIFYGVAFGSFRMLIGGVSVLYLLSKNIHLLDLGLLKSFQFALMMVIDLPLSYIADRYSRKLSTLLGILFGAFWLLTTAFATDLWHFYVAEAFNAISLSLFNGAYTSYLIDTKNRLNPNLATKTLLAYDNKYSSLGMAICAFVGVAFLNPTSNVIWIIAGILLAIVCVGGFFHLPSDNLQSHHPQNDNAPSPTTTACQTPTKQEGIKDNIRNLIAIITSNQMIFYGLIIISILLIYFQTLLQLWQPIIALFNQHNFGWLYGLFFSIVSLAQLLSSYLVNHNINHKHAYIIGTLVLSLILMTWATLLLQTHPMGIVIIVLALFAMFFAIKFLMIEASAKFHDVIPNHHRSLLDGMTFFISRTALLIAFPIITYWIEKIGFIALAGIFLMLLISYLAINHRFKLNQSSASNV